MGIETRMPMGLTIIGGTVVSTVLTLFVVPALYLAMAVLETNKRPSSDARGRDPDALPEVTIAARV
jgi:hypothetical protein